MRCLNPLLTFCTVEEVEDYTWSRPSLTNSLMQAINVEDVAAFYLDARGGLETFAIANTAVITFLLIHRSSSIFLYAIFVKAREANLLDRKSVV